MQRRWEGRRVWLLGASSGIGAELAQQLASAGARVFISARRKELATRVALGASTRGLVRLVLVESLALAAVGAVVGTALAVGGLKVVRALGIDHSGQGFEFAIDAAVLGFSAAAALVAALVSSALPLLALNRTDLARAVHEAGRLGGGGRHARGLRTALVVVQLSVSVALLVGAGLLTKSFFRMQQSGPGFSDEGVWTNRGNRKHAADHQHEGARGGRVSAKGGDAGDKRDKPHGAGHRLCAVTIHVAARSATIPSSRWRLARLRRPSSSSSACAGGSSAAARAAGPIEPK